MGILVDEQTRVVVQGITGREGRFHTQACMAYGANVVAGVTPGRGGQKVEETVPVFDTVEQAVAETGANVSLIFVPAPSAMDALVESGRGRYPIGGLHFRGCPRVGHHQGGRIPENQLNAPDRPQTAPD